MGNAVKAQAPSVCDPASEARVLPLVELAARAATDPDVWNAFVAALSAELDDAAVVMTLELPNDTTQIAYRVHFRDELWPLFRKQVLRREIPWSVVQLSKESFCDFAAFFADETVPGTNFHREFLEPQGFAPQAPVGHVFGSDGDRVLAGVAIYRRLGKRAITASDLSWLDLLVPHLSQAYHVHSTLRSRVHRRTSYQRVLDRFPTGVVLLDASGAVVASNRTAARIASLHDGFSLADQQVSATIFSSNAKLKKAVHSVLDDSVAVKLGVDAGVTIERPSGLRPFSVMVSAVFAPPMVGTFDDVVAAIYISDPEFRQLEMRSLLAKLYPLTKSETELAALLCEGETLEDAARARGVSLHTARSHLKKIFLKTNTTRQADLVALVTGGLMNLRARENLVVEPEAEPSGHRERRRRTNPIPTRQRAEEARTPVEQELAVGLAPRSAAARALPLVRLVVCTANNPDAWWDFVAALSRELDNAAVTLALELPLVGSRLAYRIGIGPEYVPVINDYVARRALPWSLAEVPKDVFRDMGGRVPSEMIRATDFYRDFLEPQGLSPQVPVACMFGSEGGRMRAGIAVYRRSGQRALTPDDFALLDLLAPHLKQAYRVHAKLRDLTHRENAYEQVIDRFPTGVVLLDANGEVLVSNRAARRIAALNDGFSLEAKRVRATAPASAAALKKALHALLERPFDVHLGYEEGVNIERPSGARAFSVMVSPLFAGTADGMFEDAVAAVYITDPEFHYSEMRSLLGTFHHLTDAEVELAALLCEGVTIKGAADARGVSIHTARSQLKSIFLKTGTRRQADLVRIVKAGLTELGPNIPGDSQNEG